MKEQLTTAQNQSKNYKKYDTHPLPSQSNPNINEPPPNLPISPSSAVTMIMISLAQMRQSYECESKESWNIQLTLGIWTRPLGQPTMLPARNHPHLLIPSAQTINQEKSNNSEVRCNSRQIIWYCLVYTEPRLKGGRLGTQP